MASVAPYETAKGRRWRVRYRTPNRQQTEKRGFRTKREAQAFAQEIEVSMRRGEYSAPSAGRVTVDEIAGDWLARRQQASAPSHARMLESAWRVHVAPRWGDVALADIDVLGVEAWVAEMTRAGSGAGTVRRNVSVLGGILDDAVKAKRLAGNPVRRVENLPRRTGRRHIYLSGDDVMRLAEASGEHRALVLTLGLCGIRWGEAVALRVRDVEFLRRRLQIHEQAVAIGSRYVVGPTKGRSARSVPVPAIVLDALSECATGKAPEALVFGDGTEFLQRPRGDRGWFAAAVRAAGVPDITPHDLRHTCASLAISAGANVLALQRMLGHKSATVTLDVYADLFDSDLDAVAEAIETRIKKSTFTAL